MNTIPFRCRITPNSTKAVVLVKNLLPDHLIDVGDAYTAGLVYGVNREEFDIVNELLAPEGAKLIRETFA